jgi:hypothetical protein
LASHLATERRAGSPNDGANRPPQIRVDGAALLRELGGHLDPGQPGADDRDPGVTGQLLQGAAEPLRRLEFGHGVSEFGCSRYRCRHRRSTAGGVDDVVVIQRAARRQQHFALGDVDAGRAIDDQAHAVTDQHGVIGRGVAGPGRELMQPKTLHELRTWVDERDLNSGVLLQTVGRQGSGVAAADDDDLVDVVVISHAH